MFKNLTKIIIFLTLLLPFSIFAANITHNQETSPAINVSDEILVSFSFDTEGLSYNTISGVIKSSDSLNIERVISGNSIISIWLDDPTKAKTGEIKFSGIVPGGFNGVGHLFDIVIKPSQKGSVNLEMSDIEVFLNDGIGTPNNLDPININFTVTNNNQEPSLVEIIDTDPPLPFTVELVKDPSLFDGQYVLIFNTTDKGSGVKTYHVIEGSETYTNITSPYLLRNQQISEKIYVKAIDFNGNERLEPVPIPNIICFGSKCLPQNIFALGIILLSLLAITLLWKFTSKLIKTNSN